MRVIELLLYRQVLVMRVTMLLLTELQVIELHFSAKHCY
jgi:hypothetical protein